MAEPSPSSSSMSLVPAATSSPPSLSSSPSHDFTFTISLYPSPPKGPNRSAPRPRTATNAIDLAPADDIFFQGHLLPLRLLRRPPFSPRRSAESLAISLNSTSGSTVAEQSKEKPSNEPAGKVSKSFTSIITGLTRWWREAEKEEDSDMDTTYKEKDSKKEARKKKKFDMKKTLKRYSSIVEALFSPRGAAREKRDLQKRPYSFSGVSNHWSRGGERQGSKRWGQLSAPASMRTSPTNSGLLVVPPNLGSSDESTMDELQNAIQAAIAHCKKSMNKEEMCKTN